MLPKGVQFGFEWGDGFVAWNEVGPPEAVFDIMPHGACAWAEEHHSTDPRFDIDLDSTMIHNQTFLNKICALLLVQIDRHVSRHGSFLVARDFIGTQTLGLSQAAAVLASLRHLGSDPQTYDTEFDLGGLFCLLLRN